MNWSNIELIWFQKALVTSHSRLFSGTKGNTYPRLMLGNYALQLCRPIQGWVRYIWLLKNKSPQPSATWSAPSLWIQSRTKWAETFDVVKKQLYDVNSNASIVGNNVRRLKLGETESYVTLGILSNDHHMGLSGKDDKCSSKCCIKKAYYIIKKWPITTNEEQHFTIKIVLLSILLCKNNFIFMPSFILNNDNEL